MYGEAMPAMQEPTLLVLTVLASGPRHGYGVIQDVSALSDGAVVLRASTLYAALDRLAEQGLVTVDGEEVADGRLRRYYRLTDSGAGRLADEVARLRRNAAAAAAGLRKRSGAALTQVALGGTA
jgi:PadR family transcriptional regulator, regulatory protein PadR